MTITQNPLDHPRGDNPENTGQFNTVIPTPPVVTLKPGRIEVLDGEGGIWSPHKNQVTVTKTGSGAYDVALDDHGFVSFDLSRFDDLNRTSPDDEEFIDQIEIMRSGDKVTAVVGRKHMDFTELVGAVPEDGEDEDAAGTWLNDHAPAIHKWLLDEYGMHDDNVMDWNSSSVLVTVDMTAASRTDGDRLVIDTGAVTTAAKEHADGGLRRLQNDVWGGVFMSRLREHLNA